MSLAGSRKLVDLCVTKESLSARIVLLECRLGIVRFGSHTACVLNAMHDELERMSDNLCRSTLGRSKHVKRLRASEEH